MSTSMPKNSSELNGLRIATSISFHVFQHRAFGLIPNVSGKK